MSKSQLTEEFTRKVCALIYYVHTTIFNRINCNFPRVLVGFHTKRRSRVSLSVRVSDLGQPVTYARQFCMNNPGNKIY